MDPKEALKHIKVLLETLPEDAPPRLVQITVASCLELVSKGMKGEPED